VTPTLGTAGSEVNTSLIFFVEAFNDPDAEASLFAEAKCTVNAFRHLHQILDATSASNGSHHTLSLSRITTRNALRITETERPAPQ